MEDTRQLGGADVLVLDVLVMMKVKGQVTVKVLLEVKVLVKVFVVEKVFLSSLSSTPFPRTRPAARVWAWGPVARLCSRHPADVVLDPFPETRPLP